MTDDVPLVPFVSNRFDAIKIYDDEINRGFIVVTCLGESCIERMYNSTKI